MIESFGGTTVPSGSAPLEAHALDTPVIVGVRGQGSGCRATVSRIRGRRSRGAVCGRNRCVGLRPLATEFRIGNGSGLRLGAAAERQKWTESLNRRSRQQRR